MTQPIHTLGPVIARPQPESKVGRITITGSTSPVAIAEIVPTTTKGYDAAAEANGRLIRAAYNAFDSAARALGCNAVELAERMQEGEIAELAQALDLAEYALGNAVKPDCWRDFEDLKVWAQSLFLPAARAILAKVKGGPT